MGQHGLMPFMERQRLARVTAGAAEVLPMTVAISFFLESFPFFLDPRDTTRSKGDESRYSAREKAIDMIRSRYVTNYCIHTYCACADHFRACARANTDAGS